MKLLKKSFLILVLVLIFATAAAADVLPWPDNSYFQNNEEEMEPMSGGYMVNCSGNNQKFYSAPGKMIAEFTVPRGEIVYPSYRCTKQGKEWCIVEQWSEAYSCGWCPMDVLLPLYNSSYFTEEHAEEIDEGFTQKFDEGTVLYFYSYPGSGVTSDYATVLTPEPLEFIRSYTDSEGRKWGCVGYWYGIRDCWLCIDDPTNDSLPFVPAAKRNDGSYIEAYTVPEYLEASPAEETVSTQPSGNASDSESSKAMVETDAQSASSASLTGYLIPILIVSLLVIIAVLGLFWIVRKQK